MPRGTIKNRDRAKQINDFSGLKYGTITPTDLDGLIEYHNQAYIILEIKYNNSKMPEGQRIALERLTKDLFKTGKPTICIVAEHTIDDPNLDVDVANAKVRKYKCNDKKWKEDCNGTVKDHIDNFLSWAIPKPGLAEFLKKR